MPDLRINSKLQSFWIALYVHPSVRREERYYSAMYVCRRRSLTHGVAISSVQSGVRTSL